MMKAADKWNVTGRMAAEAIRGEKTLSQLGSQFKVHPIQIGKWRKTGTRAG
jgi:hypothetical protein